MENANDTTIKSIKDYKSSPSRAIQSLGLSNQRLRQKNASRKGENKRLSVRIKDLEESREKWKIRTKELEKKLKAAQSMILLLQEQKKNDWN